MTRVNRRRDEAAQGQSRGVHIMADGLVYLVGRRLPHNENLGLGYLSAALTEARLPSQLRWLNSGADVEPIAREIVREAPDVVGLALPDGGSAFLPLALGELLRRLGYRGHITSGGAFATLARAWLLERYGWLDSVVRFAGEVPIVEIARAVAAGQGVEGLAGVTTRAGDGRVTDGRAAAVLDDAPMRLTPERTQLSEILGVRAAHLCASRGCAGRCHYCGPAALHTLARAEGRRGGATLAQLDDGGVGTVRWRDLEALADEMAALYHERDVRYFYLVDEHVLPYDEPGALAYLREWRKALAARRVGPIGIGGMLRADRLTPAIVDELAETGIIRTFVGLELASDEEGRRFGRTAPTARELALLGRFAQRGIATVSNLMLVHPYSTVESVGRALDFCAGIGHGVLEATRMQVYHGTRLHERMLAEGRLIGNPLRWGYVFETPEMERFAEIFARLRGEAFHDYSVACRTHDAHLALALARRLWGTRVPKAATERLERARAALNALYVEAYRSGLRLAVEGGGFHDATSLVRAMRARAEGVEVELDRVEELLSEGPARAARWFAPMRAAAASALTFTLAVVPAASGCYLSHGPLADAGTDAGRRDAAATDGGEHLDASTCSPAQVTAATDLAVARVRAADACFNGTVTLTPPATADAVFQTSAFVAGSLQLRTCRGAPSDGLAAAIESRVESALSAPIPACTPAYVEVTDGGAQTDMSRLAASLDPCAAVLYSGGGPIVVVLDGRGAVSDVRTTDPGSPVAACVRRVLEGLSFPCLASFEVCPEYIISE